MTESNIGVFIEQMSDSGQSVLHPAELLSSTDGVYSMKLQSERPVEEPGEAITIYFEKGRSFLKQWARVDSWKASEGFAEIQATLLGDPCSAEQRENYRVSAVMADLCIDLADETGCKLMARAVKFGSSWPHASGKPSRPTETSGSQGLGPVGPRSTDS